MGGTAWVTGSIIAPGVVRQTGTYQRLIFGELDGSMSRRGQALSDACAAAGFEGDFSANVLLPVWEKFLAIVPLSSVNSLTRVPLGVYREDPELWGLCEASLRETAPLDAAPRHDLDVQRSLARQPARTAVVCRQGGRTRAPARHPDSGL